MYKHYLSAGARCVEIDAWDGEENKEEPKGKVQKVELSFVLL